MQKKYRLQNQTPPDLDPDFHISHCCELGKIHNSHRDSVPLYVNGHNSVLLKGSLVSKGENVKGMKK